MGWTNNHPIQYGADLLWKLEAMYGNGVMRDFATAPQPHLLLKTLSIGQKSYPNLSIVTGYSIMLIGSKL